MSHQNSSFTIALNTKTPTTSDGKNLQWVHLLPPGQFSARDGRGPWLLKNAEQVIANTRRYLGDTLAPVDYDHQTENAINSGNPAPAAGWITQLSADNEGLWGLIKWSDRAKRFIDAKEYKYISPVFNHANDGTVIKLLRAALTNIPALDLTAIASIKCQTLSNQSTDMKKIKDPHEIADFARVFQARMKDFGEFVSAHEAVEAVLAGVNLNAVATCSGQANIDRKINPVLNAKIIRVKNAIAKEV